MPNDCDEPEPEMITLLQQMLEELQNSRKAREDLGKSLANRPDSSKEFLEMDKLAYRSLERRTKRDGRKTQPTGLVCSILLTA